MLSVCALKRLMGICRLFACIFNAPVFFLYRHISQRENTIYRLEPFEVRMCAQRFLRDTTFPHVCTVLLFKQRGAFGTSSRNPIRINPSNGAGLPPHNRMRIKFKCRALHSRSAVSRICRDSQIIFSVGARKSTLQLFLSSFVPCFVAPKGRPYLYSI